MKRLRWLGGVLVLTLGGTVAAFLLGRGGGARGPADLVPADALGYVEIASLSAPRPVVEGLARRIGFEGVLGSGRDALARQLGFDPFVPEQARAHGLDPARPLALFSAAAKPAGAGAAVLLLPILDRSRAHQTVASLWETRTGGHVETADRDGVELWQVLDGTGAVSGAFGVRDAYLVLAVGEEGPARVAAVLREGGPRLGRVPPFQAARSAIGSGTLLFAWGAGDLAEAAGSSPLLKEGVDGGAMGIVAGDRDLDLRFFGDLRATVTPQTKALVAARPDAVGRLLDRLDPRMPLVARFSLAPEVLWKTLQSLPRDRVLVALEDQLRARGVELRDLLPALGDQLVLGLMPAPKVDLSRLPSLDPRRFNPFHAIHLEIALSLDDPAKIEEALPTVAEALGPAIRASVDAATIEGVAAYTVHYVLGEGVTFGVVDGVLTVTGGEGRFAEAVRRARAKGGGLASARPERPYLGALRSEGSVLVALDLGALRAAVGDVGPERFGGGPGGMALALAYRKLSERLAQIEYALAGVEARPGGLGGHLALRLAPAPSRGQAGTGP